MPAAHRHHDLCTGHGCWPSRPNAEASPDVFVNSRGWHRVGDAWEPHCCPSIPECHASVAGTGSPKVFVNSRAACRIGDLVACGSTMATGSANVFDESGGGR